MDTNSYLTFIYFIYLKAESKRKRECSHSLAHNSNAYNSQGWKLNLFLTWMPRTQVPEPLSAASLGTHEQEAGLWGGTNH